FEKFLHNRYIGQKRFSLEGAETLIPLLNAFVERAPEQGVQEYVLGMAHRGRLNVLANILDKPYPEVFAEFEDYFRDDVADGDGDVKYHLGFSSDLNVRGHVLHVSLTPNPSHLEAVNAVVLGRTRAKQDLFNDTYRKRGIPVLIHGDAAFAGQGSVAETLNLARLEGYTTGGALHVVINNQIGFTTSPADARSSRYCTDVAKMIQAPIFHVNADDPEAVIFVAELALEFRQKWGNDVIIDMYCYRRRGHNEGDEPAFTNPLMYSKIAALPTTSRVYAEKLIKAGVITAEESQDIDGVFINKFDTMQKTMRSQPPRARGMARFDRRWKGFRAGYGNDPVPTAVNPETLRKVGDALTHVPEGLTLHPKIFEAPHKDGEASEKKSLIDRQREMVAGREKIDWGFAEALAFGTLLVEKTPVRLTGQDSRRGTFTQRHATLFDQKTGAPYIPLNHLAADQAPFSVYDSPLSEFAVVGFEFGYTLDEPHALVMWEAQFGDFVNGAQVIIDQFLTCSYSKWQRSSGLTLLLPHGYEGAGPEHSSARLERFLQQCAEDNIQVCDPTTPAQYFHMLRRQVRRSFRLPLIVMTPKSLLRHALAKSALEEFTTGHFREVIDDPKADPNQVRRVLLCSGKLYYDFYLDPFENDPKKQMRAVPPDAAIVRIEQLYPFPDEALQQIRRKYRKATEWVWAQEEPQNMGAWTFIEPRLRALEISAEFVGRDASASTATGSHRIHKREQTELVEVALNGRVPHVVRAVRPAPRQEEPPPVAEAKTPALK
ncbi:MAG: 2-oxoglutarate dehydrogenase E1 component, partial [Gemmataceae bacterium]